ncbi:unnamed protein product [Vitrella brassicaformis CCMP3155]|uniref:Rhodanese domain-containing protein n=2 Tax=Vitrella brassicaformis TaxID=1169539 RepID=A0A0G4GLG9_VITBC|nr:unnamed protein product [Vitrella brassicaformis CCMP3155]|eukprot:CEM30980.1 unnamed protein product [Vitrella brassicaformis CCMP3155]
MDIPSHLYAAYGGGEAAVEGDADVVDSAHALKSVWSKAHSRGEKLGLLVRPDDSKWPPPLPEWLVDCPDPTESPTMTLVSFYRFTPIEDPQLMAESFRKLWEPLKALGRVYVASEGVNAQMAVPTNVLSAFARACNSTSVLDGVPLNCDVAIPMLEYWGDQGSFERWKEENPSDVHMQHVPRAFAHSDDQSDESSGEDPSLSPRRAVPGRTRAPFERLHIRVRKQIVADGLMRPLDWGRETGREVSPEEWHENVNRSDVLVLDCRNTYETDVGRFDTAVPLNTTYFRESWDALNETLKDVDKEAPIMMYCTGGIRCVKTGAYLVQELGFRNVGRLEGGIINYAKYVKGKGQPSLFKGRNYVFDNRMGENITPDVLAQCVQCGKPWSLHTNCRYERCHVRFLQCDECAEKYGGCCSRGCQRQHERSLVETDTHASSDGGWLEPPFQNAQLNRMFDDALEAYAEQHSTSEPPLLADLRQRTAAEMPHALRMLSGPLVGRLLATLSRLLRPERILEIGTFTGYSAVCFAEGLADGGQLVTIERDERAAAIAREFFDRSPFGPSIDLRVGMAADVLPHLRGQTFDLVFIDGDKKKYKEYYDYILEEGMLSARGLMLVDNVLWKGGVLLSDGETSDRYNEWLANEETRRGLSGDDSRDGERREADLVKLRKRHESLWRAMDEFNRHVRDDPRTEQVILPIRDGLSAIRLKG